MDDELERARLTRQLVMARRLLHVAADDMTKHRLMFFARGMEAKLLQLNGQKEKTSE